MRTWRDEIRVCGCGDPRCTARAKYAAPHEDGHLKRLLVFAITGVPPKQPVAESFKTPAWPVGVRTMPFREYAPHFGPEELEILTAAFDATWQELSAARTDLSTEDKIGLMKKKLAQRILVSATAGGI
jgi:hypothetical protein